MQEEEEGGGGRGSAFLTDERRRGKGRSTRSRERSPGGKEDEEEEEGREGATRSLLILFVPLWGCVSLVPWFSLCRTPVHVFPVFRRQDGLAVYRVGLPHLPVFCREASIPR